MNKKSDPFNKARQYAFLLLKFRPRSSQEVSQRLKKRNFDPKAIRETISYLEEKNFLNDREFTRSWIESRAKRGYGLKRIRRELVLKGVDNEIIATEMQEIKQRFSEEDSLNLLAQERWHRLKGLAPAKAKQRLFAYLIRRGFPPDLIIEAVSNLTGNKR